MGRRPWQVASDPARGNQSCRGAQLEGHSKDAKKLNDAKHLNALEINDTKWRKMENGDTGSRNRRWQCHRFARKRDILCPNSRQSTS
jgi:hypothetical protein